jgi:tRNA(Ile2) C34 agmatinyltransferase TiaS
MAVVEDVEQGEVLEEGWEEEEGLAEVGAEVVAVELDVAVEVVHYNQQEWEQEWDVERATDEEEAEAEEGDVVLEVVLGVEQAQARVEVKGVEVGWALGIARE